MKRMIAILLTLLLIVAPMGAMAEGKGVKGIKFDPKFLTLDIGVSQDLVVLTKPANATPQYKWKSANESIATVDEDGVVTAVAPGSTTILVRTKNGKTAKCGVTVRDPEKIVALTFDDGPCDNTLKILDVLKQYNAVATFFMLGSSAKSNPNDARAVANAGCEVGSHSSDHNNLQKLSLKDASDDLARSMKDISDATGTTPKIVRAPYGAIDESLAKALGFPFIQWSIDPEDWKDRDGDTVYRRIMDKVKPGAIVLMHDLYASTTDAVKKLVPELSRQGYTFVTISDLIARRGIGDATGQIIF